jgi:HD-like signal output (HDOD) protein
MSELVIRATIERVGAVATLPAVAMRIMRIAEDPTANEDDLHEALLSDPALAARVLKVVNSAFYRRQREVSNPRSAIRLLGVDAIRNIALAASLHRLFRGRRAIADFEAADVWTHCVAVGAAARALALRTHRVAPEEAMLAGLLHDIGLIVAMQTWLPEFTNVVTKAAVEPLRSFRELERAEMGATHEQFGGALCEAWHFPVALARACSHHHDFRSLPAEEQVMPALIHVADAVAARVGAGYVRTVDAEAPLADALLLLGLSHADLELEVRDLRDALPDAVALLAA